MISSSTTASGMTSLARLRSPAAHASHIGLEDLAAPEPAVELGVGVDGQVRRDHPSPDEPRGVGVLGGDDEEARRDGLALADLGAALARRRWRPAS